MHWQKQERQRPEMSQIQWPAIIKLAGEDELIYLPDEASLLNHPHLQNLRFQRGDYLYDSTGREFVVDELKPKDPRPSGRHLSLEEIIQLLRLHAAQDGSCCVAKLNARSIADAIALLA